jgi:hypothetical protein
MKSFFVLAIFLMSRTPVKPETTEFDSSDSSDFDFLRVNDLASILRRSDPFSGEVDGSGMEEGKHIKLY